MVHQRASLVYVLRGSESDPSVMSKLLIVAEQLDLEP